MLEIKELSEKQKQVMAHGAGSDTVCFAGGAIRSGKTTACTLGMALWILKNGMDHSHALIGQSVETAMRNAGFDMLDHFHALGVNAEFSRSLGSCITIPYDGKETRLWIFGADNERSSRRIQGATLKGLMVEELAILPESFWQMAWGRLSVEGAKCWATYNPEGPMHWCKQKVVDRVDKFRGHVVDFRMRDNPSLSEEILRRYDESYVGHWHARMILGQWAGATGLIFPYWTAEDKPPEGKLTLALDWASASVFAAIAIFSQGKKHNVYSELYFDARESSPRTEQEHFDSLEAWVKTFSESLRGKIIYVDPATPNTFKRLLRTSGAFVRNGDNDVLPGLITTATRLQREEITIGNCPKLKEELGGYQWDAKAADIGEDKPQKTHDHACDALRYFAHSTGKIGRLIKPTTVRSIGM